MKRFVMSGFLIGFAAASCFAPVYHEPESPENTWGICCRDQEITTCECLQGWDTCNESFLSCAKGACVTLTTASPSCSDKPTNSTTGDAGVNASAPSDAGIVVDAGTALTDAGPGSTVGEETKWLPCCINSKTTSCACPQGECVPEAFVACKGGRCALGNSTKACGP